MRQDCVEGLLLTVTEETVVLLTAELSNHLSEEVHSVWLTYLVGIHDGHHADDASHYVRLCENVEESLIFTELA